DAFAHASGPGAFIASSFDLTPFVGGAIRLRFHAGWDCGNCALNEGWYVDDVVVYSHGPRWVSLSTNAVTVAPHAATTVNLAFDATGLAVGAHDAELVVRSNDPDESVLVVPIDLQVADVAATIDVDPNTLNLDRRAN